MTVYMSQKTRDILESANGVDYYVNLHAAYIQDSVENTHIPDEVDSTSPLSIDTELYFSGLGSGSPQLAGKLSLMEQLAAVFDASKLSDSATITFVVVADEVEIYREVKLLSAVTRNDHGHYISSVIHTYEDANLAAAIIINDGDNTFTADTNGVVIGVPIIDLSLSLTDLQLNVESHVCWSDGSQVSSEQLTWHREISIDNDSVTVPIDTTYDLAGIFGVLPHGETLTLMVKDTLSIRDTNIRNAAIQYVTFNT